MTGSANAIRDPYSAAYHFCSEDRILPYH